MDYESIDKPVCLLSSFKGTSFFVIFISFWLAPIRYYLYLLSGNSCTESIETLVDVLVTAVDLVDVADDAGSLCRHCCDKKSNTGTDIRRSHIAGTQAVIVVVTDDHGSMRVTKDDLSSHIDEFVHKEQTALEHLLMDQNATLALDCNHEKYAEEVRGKTWPRSIRKCHDRAIKERIYDVALLLRNKDIVSPLFHLYAKAAEAIRNDSEILI